ncbi:MAG: MHYT domain-containing protein [Bacteroidota bacterium]
MYGSSLLPEAILSPIEMAGGQFSPILVILSYVVAVIASYTTLGLVNQLTQISGKAEKRWLIAGSFSMGIGIWSMHFVGMLAFSMDMPFVYNPFLTVVSLAVGMVSSCFAIYTASRKDTGLKKILGAGLFLGPGIAGMHYTGMAAMEMEATISYDTNLFLASILIAILASIAALWIATTLARRTTRIVPLKIGAALIMGIAICGMHYTGMAAAIYTPIPGYVHDPSITQPDHWGLAIGVTVATLIILQFTILTTYFERKLNLEKHVAERLTHLVEERTADLQKQTQNLQASKAQLEKEMAERRVMEEEMTRLGRIIDATSIEIYLVHAETFKYIGANKGAIEKSGYPLEALKALTPLTLNMDMTQDKLDELLAPLNNGKQEKVTFESMRLQRDGSKYLAKIDIHFSNSGSPAVYVMMVEDITQRKQLESQLSQAQKLESIGQLAAGVAHEINTPIQYVGDNTNFFKESFGEIEELIGIYDQLVSQAREGALTAETLAEIEEALEDADFEYLAEEIPKAIDQTIEGINRVAKIVRAMKEFSHPGQEEKTLVDLNKAIETTMTVARNEWKYVADIDLQLDPALPEVPCHPGELNQVFLNIMVNAAHAIEPSVEANNGQKGKITLRTRATDEFVEVQIQDSGSGIPVHARQKIFDPFYTTKDVGKGTGQGLAIAHAVVTEKHGGNIFFETEIGQGTTFFIQIPLQAEMA